MEFIRKNKFTIVAIGVFLIVVLLLVQIKNIFFPNEGSAIYGDRLEGIEEVKITTKKKTTIKESLENTDLATSAKVRVSGRIIEVTTTVNDEVSTDAAKELSNKVLESLNDSEKKYYDIQIFISKNSDSNEFPIIGYKHHNKDGFSWTKNR